MRTLPVPITVAPGETLPMELCTISDTALAQFVAAFQPIHEELANISFRLARVERKLGLPPMPEPQRQANPPKG